jgi:hypothetical protein
MAGGDSHIFLRDFPAGRKSYGNTLIVLSVLVFIYLSIRYGVALLIWWGKRTKLGSFGSHPCRHSGEEVTTNEFHP